MPNATTIAPDGATISIRYTGTPPSHEMMAAAVANHMNSKKPSPRKPTPVPVVGRPSPPTQSLQAAAALVPQWRRTIDNTFGTGNHEGDIHQRLSGVVPGVKAAFQAANQWSDGIGEKLLSITGGTTTVQNITPAQHAANARRLLAQAKQGGAALIPPTVKDIAAGVPARTIVGNTLREARDHPFNFALNALPFAEWGALSVLGKASKLERMAAVAEGAGNAAQAAQMRTYAATLRRGAQPVHDAVTAKPLRQAVGKGVAALRKPPVPPAATPPRVTPAPPRVSPATNDAELARQVAPPGWLKPEHARSPANASAAQTHPPARQTRAAIQDVGSKGGSTRPPRGGSGPPPPAQPGLSMRPSAAMAPQGTIRVSQQTAPLAGSKPLRPTVSDDSLSRQTLPLRRPPSQQGLPIRKSPIQPGLSTSPSVHYVEHTPPAPVGHFKPSVVKRSSAISTGQEAAPSPILNVATMPGSAQGQELGDVFNSHHEVRDSIINPKTGGIRELERLGVPHEVLTTEGISTTQRWGEEPNMHIKLTGASDKTAKYISSMLGTSFGQDGMGIHSPVSPQDFYTAELAMHANQPLPKGLHRVVAVEKKNGTPWTPPEINAINKVATRYNVELQTTPDGKGIEFHDYGSAFDADPVKASQDWQARAEAATTAAGLDKANFTAHQSIAKSDYVDKSVYKKHLGASSISAGGRPQNARTTLARAHRRAYGPLTRKRGPGTH